MWDTDEEIDGESLGVGDAVLETDDEDDAQIVDDTLSEKGADLVVTGVSVSVDVTETVVDDVVHADPVPLSLLSVVAVPDTSGDLDRLWGAVPLRDEELHAVVDKDADEDCDVSAEPENEGLEQGLVVAHTVGVDERDGDIDGVSEEEDDTERDACADADEESSGVDERVTSGLADDETDALDEIVVLCDAVTLGEEDADSVDDGEGETECVAHAEFDDVVVGVVDMLNDALPESTEEGLGEAVVEMDGDDDFDGDVDAVEL